MANAAGFIKESIWRDPDWRRLPRTAQATYAQLLSQKELDRAGMLPLQVSKWVKGCDEVTEAALWHDLKLLEARRFIFVDEDTDELLVRSYMRHSEVLKYPQYLKAAIRCAGMVASPRLRHELAVELRKLRRADAVNLADEIDPGETVPEGSENPSGTDTLPEPFENPSGTVPEPFENPSGTVNPSGTLPEPSGVRERVGVVTSVGTHLGGARAREDEPSPVEPPQPVDAPPPRFCPEHQPDGTPQPCGRCKSYRLIYDRWLKDQDIATKAAEQEAGRIALAERDERLAAETEARSQAITNCPLCDGDGYNAAGRVCDHIDRTQTAARGRDLIRAALGGEAEPPDVEEDPDR